MRRVRTQLAPVRAYELGDETQLAPMLRAADLAELTASSARPPVDILREGAALSAPSCSVTYGDRVVCMFGVVPVGRRCGRIWLLGSDQMLQPPIRREIIRESRFRVAALFKYYDLLFNHIDERNTFHIRWLQWAGFTFIRRDPAYGVEQRPFLEFIKHVSST